MSAIAIKPNGNALVLSSWREAQSIFDDVDAYEEAPTRTDIEYHKAYPEEGVLDGMMLLALGLTIIAFGVICTLPHT